VGKTKQCDFFSLRDGINWMDNFEDLRWGKKVFLLILADLAKRNNENKQEGSSSKKKKNRKEER